MNALSMYLEDYSLAFFQSFILATVYLCIYCHTSVGINLLFYLFIYYFIKPASAYDFNVNWPLA